METKPGTGTAESQEAAWGADTDSNLALSARVLISNRHLNRWSSNLEESFCCWHDESIMSWMDIALSVDTPLLKHSCWGEMAPDTCL